MKVLMVGSDRKLFERGSEARMRISQYGALGEEVHIIVFAKRRLGLVREQIGKNVWIHPTNTHTKIGSVYKAIVLGVWLIQKRKGRWVLSAQDPFESGYVVSSIAKKVGVPYQVQLHADIFTKAFKKGVLNRIRLHMAHKVFQYTTRVRVVSEGLKQALIQSVYAVPAERIDVLPIHIDIQKFLNAPRVSKRSSYAKLDPLVVMLSRFEPEKNIEGVITAMKEVIAVCPRAGLLLVGDGSTKTKLESKIQELGLAEHVHFAPWTNDVSEYFVSSDMFVLNSNFEGFGRTIIEAGASGCPVISTKVGIATQFEEGKEILLCNVGDTACVAKRIIQLAKDISLRNTLAIHMKEAVKENYGETFGEYVERYKYFLELTA